MAPIKTRLALLNSFLTPFNFLMVPPFITLFSVTHFGIWNYTFLEPWRSVKFNGADRNHLLTSLRRALIQLTIDDIFLGNLKVGGVK